MVTNSKKSIGTSSTIVLAKNLSRKIADIVNDSDQVIYLALGASAVLNKGIRLNAGGGSYDRRNVVWSVHKKTQIGKNHPYLTYHY